jgi:hypothetical protein
LFLEVGNLLTSLPDGISSHTNMEKINLQNQEIIHRNNELANILDDIKSLDLFKGLS